MNKFLLAKGKLWYELCGPNEKLQIFDLAASLFLLRFQASSDIVQTNKPALWRAFHS
ncbi:hypothetical protein ACFQ1M_00060 [Sungkyunkwania multivorans]|uniref:Uncharacterized protein n=1 Tax=Sungkyunkwania multivorans TaxID=1173618 RepID=A0ABW3CVG8_9FLAO